MGEVERRIEGRIKMKLLSAKLPWTVVTEATRKRKGGNGVEYCMMVEDG